MHAERLRALARRLRLRGAAERAADSTRLLIDSLSDPVYQPVAELGRRYLTADRSAGTASRWSAMRPVLQEIRPQTAADIGCNAGWFTLELARLGIAVIGVEGHPPYYRAAITAVHRSELHNAGVMAINLTPATLGLLPSVDCLLFLSVWHHIVKESGLEAGTRFLEDLWHRTNKVMFFETGESQEFGCTEFALPEMLPDSRQWLSGYLSNTCPASEIVWLGTHPSGPGSLATRNLFALRRLRTHP
jgi:hypothetical protein